MRLVMVKKQDENSYKIALMGKLKQTLNPLLSKNSALHTRNYKIFITFVTLYNHCGKIWPLANHVKKSLKKHSFIFSLQQPINPFFVEPELRILIRNYLVALCHPCP